MEKIIINHEQGDVAIIGDTMFSIKELKEGNYTIEAKLNTNEELISIDILHESYNKEHDEPFTSSEPFEGLFQVNKHRNILAPKKYLFPTDKQVVPFQINDGNDNIGLILMAFEPVKRGRKKYNYDDIQPINTNS